MFKVRFRLVIYRYEIIIVMIILFLTGGIAVSSRDVHKALSAEDRYPFKIALTFDDGPHPGYTEKLLEILKENNVKATFFVVGSQVIKHPELLLNISSYGHEIANHTLTHPDLRHKKSYEIKKELSMTNLLIHNITGQKCSYFRPPGGRYSKEVIRIAGEVGLKMVLWTVFPKDHQERNSKIIVSKVMSQASDGGVIILHSGVKPTLKALPRIIQKLRLKGYSFTTVSQLRDLSSSNKLVWLR